MRHVIPGINMTLCPRGDQGPNQPEEGSVWRWLMVDHQGYSWMGRQHQKGEIFSVTKAQDQDPLAPWHPSHTSLNGSEVVRAPHWQDPVHEPCGAGHHRALIRHASGPDLRSSWHYSTRICTSGDSSARTWTSALTPSQWLSIDTLQTSDNATPPACEQGVCGSTPMRSGRIYSGGSSGLRILRPTS